MTGIKICGISDPAALDAAIAARASHVGFVFFAKSPRHVTVSQAAALAERAAGRIIRVGLVVDADDAALAGICAAARLDVLQLHGKETPERAARIGAQFGVKVWKALAVACAEDVAKAAAYRDAVDCVLFDAKTPQGALPGGMGLAFDWQLLAGGQAPRAAVAGMADGWGLAGGLDAGNVAQAIRLTRAPLVDCSSGVESAPGVKDAGLIAAFCRAAREA